MTADPDLLEQNRPRARALDDYRDDQHGNRKDQEKRQREDDVHHPTAAFLPCPGVASDWPGRDNFDGLGTAGRVVPVVMWERLRRRCDRTLVHLVTTRNGVIATAGENRARRDLASR